MESNGTTAVRAFIDAFNAQDHQALAASLNYPHVRLANGRFMEVASAAEYASLSGNLEPRLRAEGWDHTVIRTMSVVHSGENKEHIALTIDRCDATGRVYNSFDTLWIATLVDGHWGIQFRSSFLR